MAVPYSGTFKRHYRRALDCGGLVFPGSHRRNQHHPVVFAQAEDHESTIINGVHALGEYRDWIAGFILAGWIFLDSRQFTGILAFDRDRFDNRFNPPPAFHLASPVAGPAKTAICGSAEFLTSLFSGWFILHEPILWNEISAAILILVALLISVRLSKVTPEKGLKP